MSPATRTVLAVALVAALGLAVYLLFFSGRQATAPQAPAADAPASAEVREPAPPPPAAQIPPRDTEVDGPRPSDGLSEAAEPQLPALDDSDPEIRSALLAILGDGPLQRWLAEDHLVQRITSQISGLRRGAFAPETLLLEPPPGDFRVERRDGRLYPSADNYRRYDTMVALILGADVEAVAEFFHRYRPLLETAYAQLGHPAEQFDAAVLGAIDHLLATPEPDSAPELAAESVAYRYADPRLEGLSDAHKQLLRTGPGHTRELKAWLRNLRAALVAGETPPPPG
jgi:flagellar basal body-associated protein FliL